MLSGDIVTVLCAVEKSRVPLFFYIHKIKTELSSATLGNICRGRAADEQ